MAKGNRTIKRQTMKLTDEQRQESHALGVWLGTRGAVDECPIELKRDYIIYKAAHSLNTSMIELYEMPDKQKQNKWIMRGLELLPEGEERDLFITEAARQIAAGADSWTK